MNRTNDINRINRLNDYYRLYVINRLYDSLAYTSMMLAKTQLAKPLRTIGPAEVMQT